MTIRRAVLLLAFAAACGDEPPTSLVAHDRWAIGALDYDPQADHAPAIVDCARGTYHVDGVPPYQSFEVTTGDCNFLSASQPIRTSIDSGANLHLVVWHLDLDASLPGPGHAAIAIGGQLLWEVEVDVPSKAALFDVRIPAPRDFEEGEIVVFHVHNHGTNEWNVQTVARE